MSKLSTIEKIKFPFEEDKTDPILFFASIQNFFMGLNTLQKEVIKKADPLYDVEFALHEIKRGSLCADFIKTIIIPDEHSGELNLADKAGDIQKYSDTIQDIVLNKFVSKKNDLLSNNDMLEVSKEIESVASETEVVKNTNFKKPNILTVLNSVQSFQKVANGMSENFSYEYHRGGSTIVIPRFYVDVNTDSLIDATQSKEKTTHFENRTLRIKQADFLGRAKWHFKLDAGQSIEAKILDEAWLEKFHAKKIKIGSGDCLVVDGFIKDIHDDSDNIISSEWFITDIQNIIEG